MLKYFEKKIDELENNLTLKKDYTQELEDLDNINGDISVMITMNCDRIKANQLKSRIRHIENWIKQEIANQ